tara:strand:+ start:23726 stop:25876 length:2151 start_codon:yes stop_codon:yes gene_type:complete
MTAKLAKFDFKQGFNRETTQYAEEGKWFDGNRVRFRAERPENMRGYATKVSTAFDGSARDLMAWKDNSNKKRALFATPEKVYEHDGDQITDITPITTVVTLANVFGTTAGSTRVCCSDGSHGRQKGDYVLFTSAAVFGSDVSLTGNVYQITSIVDTNVFTISISGNAGATSTQAGSATFNYYIATGTSVASQGVGYGASDYNAADPTSIGLSKISSTSGNALVTVSCASAHGGVANDFIVFQNTSIDSVAATIGGNLNLTKPAAGGPLFTIVSVNGTQVIISAAANASASGDVTSSLNMTALVYKQTGGGGSGRAWNAEASADATDLALDIAQWSMDNWDENVLLNRRGSNIYYFITQASTSPVRATTVTTSPISVNSVIVSPNDRHVIALGANEFSPTATVSGTFNPMLVRWSDQNSRTNWVPSVSSTAGEVVLTDGTRIVGGVRSKNAINIWTDNSLWLMEFAGPPFTFKFQQAGTNCGLIGPHAGIDYNGVTYWMGYDNFYANTGQVEVLDCTVRRFVFDKLNTSYYDKVYAGINSEFKEIIWLFVSNDATECDSYVIFSPDEGYWVYGDTFFTTFKDREVFGNTITTGATTTGNFLYNNEPAGVFTGDGETLTSFIESADFDVDDGNAIMFMNRIIPDFDLSTGKIKLELISKQYPESTDSITKEFDITNTTQKVDLRARGRQAKVRVSCAANNASWKWGSIRLAVQGDGGR